MHVRRETLQHALDQNDLSSIVALVKDNRKVLNQLIRLSYDKETLASWRAIKAIGLAAKELVRTDYTYLREMVRKLLWSLNDESGGIGWSAPEILGEIVSADPDQFQDIIPLIAEIYGIEEVIFRPGVMYALNRIAEAKAELVLPHKDLMVRALSDRDPLVRAYALKLVDKMKGFLSRHELVEINKLANNLSEDASEVWIYVDNNFKNMQIKELFKSIITD
ncbi:MAG TPA: hypothetical protein VL197_01435 [Nitrospirota bacterium]|nr:hypothetical protein [Nitrospirota bacterium]